MLDRRFVTARVTVVEMPDVSSSIAHEARVLDLFPPPPPPVSLSARLRVCLSVYLSPPPLSLSLQGGGGTGISDIFPADTLIGRCYQPSNRQRAS